MRVFLLKVEEKKALPSVKDLALVGFLVATSGVCGRCLTV